MQSIQVKTPDGISLAAQDWGNPGGREILFIHGFNQAHLSWLRQVNDPALQRDFRMVTYDLRGHGMSDKPPEAARYADGKLWGDDVAAVMAATNLKRPVLVGWSYGGRVIADYLRTHGEARIAGINYVNARTVVEASMFGPGRLNFPNMQSDDLATNIAGTRGFLRACFAKQPSEEDFEAMLAFNMVVPALVRRNILGRPAESSDVLSQITCPVLITHGKDDQVLLASMADFTATKIKGAKLSFYDGVGHSPFWEDAARFNRELAGFVSATR
jgi:pimeloyl-ACP methyl ester carboxylesterase